MTPLGDGLVVRTVTFLTGRRSRYATRAKLQGTFVPYQRTWQSGAFAHLDTDLVVSEVVRFVFCVAGSVTRRVVEW